MKFKILLLGLFVLNVVSCSSSEKNEDKSCVLEGAASKAYDEEFPRKWPAKKIESFSIGQQKIIQKFKSSVEEYLSCSGDKYISSETFVKVLPSSKGYLSPLSKKLKKYKSDLVIDFKYFASNPFSAGTYLSETETMLLSPVSIGNSESIAMLFEHEFTHVQTHKDFKDKKPSVFHCKFKGERFKPHYLYCDEMRAYLKDIESMKKKKGNSKKSVKSKVWAAKNHTQPVISLIENLDTDKVQFKDDVTIVEGKDSNGDFYVEFPTFNLKAKTKKDVEAHLGLIKKKPQVLMTRYFN